MPAPRFLLILSIHSNLIRAGLVTRELRIASSAQQSFQLNASEFDPAEVWYKTKKVIAACLDIGRTLSREIAGVVIVSSEANTVSWQEQGSEVIARGLILPETSVTERAEMPASTEKFSSTLSGWLLWNLTGAYTAGGTHDYGKTRARSPFDAELPVLAVLSGESALELVDGSDDSDANRAIIGAARAGWEKLSDDPQNEFVHPRVS